MSKAIAQLNAFLRDCLKVDSGVLEVASSAAAKAFVGEFRVTGLTEENEYGAKPACDVDDLSWLVRDVRRPPWCHGVASVNRSYERMAGPLRCCQCMGVEQATVVSLGPSSWLPGARPRTCH